MLSLSAYYHNGNCLNESARDFLLQLDYFGIAVMISGSTVAPFYYGFMCEQGYYLVYSGIVWFFCTLAALAVLTPSLMKS